MVPKEEMINIIESGKHYGWPYFLGYDYDDADKFRSPHVGKYTKPIFYTPSIGISEIIFYEGEEFPRWKNKFLVSSLKEKSLYLLDTDFKQMKVLSSEKITIGHRIRDLNTLKDGRIIIVTDDQKLLILSRTNAPRSNPKAFKKIPIIKSVN